MPMVRPRKAVSLSMLMMGFIFAVAGGCISWFLSSDTTLTCRRSTDSCILEKIAIRGEKEVVATLPLSRLKSAEVDSKASSRRKNSSSKRTYQVVLRTDDGTIPFSDTWTGDREAHQKIATDINTYLASSEESLSIFRSGKSVRVVGYVFFAAGCLMFFGGLRGILKTASSHG